MPDGAGGAAVGAGGGAIIGGAMYILNQFLGSGRAVKGLDANIADWKEDLEKEIAGLRVLLERAAGFVEKLHDWHNVPDPDDPAGKIWYFGVSPRAVLRSLNERVGKLVDLTDKVVSRFDQYNTTTEKLITVVESLQKDVSALSQAVGRIDRGGR